MPHKKSKVLEISLSHLPLLTVYGIGPRAAETYFHARGRSGKPSPTHGARRARPCQSGVLRCRTNLLKCGHVKRAQRVSAMCGILRRSASPGIGALPTKRRRAASSDFRKVSYSSIFAQRAAASARVPITILTPGASFVIVIVSGRSHSKYIWCSFPLRRYALYRSHGQARPVWRYRSAWLGPASHLSSFFIG